MRVDYPGMAVLVAGVLVMIGLVLPLPTHCPSDVGIDRVVVTSAGRDERLNTGDDITTRRGIRRW